MMDRVKENVFEFLDGQQVCTATLSSKRYVNKIKKLVEQYPNEFEITAENSDGSIVVHFPVKCITISTPRQKKELSEEERKAIRERFLKV